MPFHINKYFLNQFHVTVHNVIAVDEKPWLLREVAPKRYWVGTLLVVEEDVGRFADPPDMCGAGAGFAAVCVERGSLHN
jgi:hypothetical protein